MRRCIAFALALLLAGCSSKPAASDHSPGGIWSGEYGPTDSDRGDPIRVDLRWEDAKLSGVVHAGTRSLPITTASFQPDTGAITMEFDTQGNGGRTVHYIIEGKVSGNTMSGTWTHDDQHGSFRVKKE